MKVLLAADESDASNAVTHEVSARPWPARSEFWVLTALDPFFFTRAPLLLKETEKKAIESLEETVLPLKQAGLAVKIDVVLENPRHGIPRLASEWNADLIVLGSRGRGALVRLLMGSTAQAVLRHAKCSVEIVRERRKEQRGFAEGMRILIPTDGSDYANHAAQSVAQRPWPAASEFRLIAVPELPVLAGDFPYYSTEQVAELAKSTEGHAKEAAAKAAEFLIKAGLRVTSVITPAGDAPARAILEAADAWSADLIVVGSHGRRGLDRIVLGSVSESIAMHAQCSVEVNRSNA